MALQYAYFDVQWRGRKLGIKALISQSRLFIPSYNFGWYLE